MSNQTGGVLTQERAQEISLDYQMVIDNNIRCLEHMDSEEWWDMETSEQLKFVRTYLNYVCMYDVTDVWFSYNAPHDRFRITVELRSRDGKSGSSFYYWVSKYDLASSLRDMQQYITNLK